MLAVDTLLHEPIRIDALALLSSSCIALDEWRAQWARSRALHELPVLVTHGRADSDLALSAGERLRDELRSAGADVQWLAFDGGHEIPLQVWRQLRKMLNAVLANGPDIIRR
jgi:phospholipase/carboxylesterase